MADNNTNLYETTTAEELLSGAAEETTVAELVEEVTRGEVGFTPENLSWSLPIMGKGMLGIFIVTAIIVLVTVVLNKATSSKKKEKKDK